MSLFSDLDPTDAVAPVLLDSGEEYELTLMDLKENSGVGDNGPWRNIQGKLACISEPNSRDIYVTFWEPKSTATEKQKNGARWAMKQFLDCFGLEVSQVADLEQGAWREATGFAVVGQKARRDDPENFENFVKTWKPKSN